MSNFTITLKGSIVKDCVNRRLWLKKAGMKLLVDCPDIVQNLESKYNQNLDKGFFHKFITQTAIYCDVELYGSEWVNGGINLLDGCYGWILNKVDGGYGCFGGRKLEYHAHRASYKMFVGNIPKAKGVCIDHLCHNRACANPNHLRITDNKGNSARRKEMDYTYKGALVDSLILMIERQCYSDLFGEEFKFFQMHIDKIKKELSSLT